MVPLIVHFLHSSAIDYYDCEIIKLTAIVGKSVPCLTFLDRANDNLPGTSTEMIRLSKHVVPVTSFFVLISSYSYLRTKENGLD